MSNGEQETNIVNHIAELAPLVFGLALVGVLMLTFLKLTSHPQLSWFEVMLPIGVLLAAFVVLTVAVALLALIAGFFAAAFGIVGGFIVAAIDDYLSKRSTKKKLAAADAYDSEAQKLVRERAANSPLGRVGNAMGNVSKNLAQFGRPVPRTQDDTRL